MTGLASRPIPSRSDLRLGKKTTVRYRTDEKKPHRRIRLEAFVEQEWFYRRDGQQCGPVSAERIRELLLAGDLQANQAIWRRNEENLRYVRADTVLKAEMDHDRSHSG